MTFSDVLESEPLPARVYEAENDPSGMIQYMLYRPNKLLVPCLNVSDRRKEGGHHALFA